MVRGIYHICCCVILMSVGMRFLTIPGLCEPYVAIEEQAAFKSGEIKAVVLATFIKAESGGTLPLGEFHVDEIIWGQKVPNNLSLAIDLGQGCDVPPDSHAVERNLRKGSCWILFLSQNTRGYFLNHELVHRGRFRSIPSNIRTVKDFVRPEARLNLDSLK